MSQDTLTNLEQACYHAGCSIHHAAKAARALFACDYAWPVAIVVATAAFFYFAS